MLENRKRLASKSAVKVACALSASYVAAASANSIAASSSGAATAEIVDPVRISVELASPTKGKTTVTEACSNDGCEAPLSVSHSMQWSEVRSPTTGKFHEQVVISLE